MLSRAMLANYPFVEGVGTSAGSLARDAASWLMTLLNAPPWAVIGNLGAVNLNGTTQSGTITAKRMDGSKTFRFIFQPDFNYDDGFVHNIFWWELDANNYIIITKFSDNYIVFNYMAGGALDTASAIVVFVAGNILVLHAVINIPTNEIRFYVNGVSKAFSVTLGAMSVATSIITIGREPAGASYFDGKVGGIVFWSVPLNLGQVVDNYDEVKYELGLV